jgi:hypothetical protein
MHFVILSILSKNIDIFKIYFKHLIQIVFRKKPSFEIQIGYQIQDGGVKIIFKKIKIFYRSEVVCVFL